MLRNAKYGSPMVESSIADLGKGIDAVGEGRYGDARKLFESAISYSEVSYSMASSMAEKISLLDMIYEEALVLRDILHDLNWGVSVSARTKADKEVLLTFALQVPASAPNTDIHDFISEASRLEGDALLYVNDNAKALYLTNNTSRRYKDYVGESVFMSKLLYADTSCISAFIEIVEALSAGVNHKGIGSKGILAQLEKIGKSFDSAIQDLYDYKFDGTRIGLSADTVDIGTIVARTREKDFITRISEAYGERLAAMDPDMTPLIEKRLKKIENDINLCIGSLDAETRLAERRFFRIAETNAMVASLPYGLGMYAYILGDYFSSVALMAVATAMVGVSYFKVRAKRLLRRKIDD
ncbi:MAG: hypothetical protein QXW10_03705 [Candidatus Micrarchaeaceae archaeon]